MLPATRSTSSMPQHRRPPTQTRSSIPWVVGVVIAVLLLSASLLLHLAYDKGTLRKHRPLLLAPMLSGLDHCLQNTNSEHPELALPETCLGPEGSAAALVQASLNTLGPELASGLTLGYSLKAPLLDFLRRDASGWHVDKAAVRRLIRTVRDVPRPVVLYLFATHFETHAPIEAELAQDPSNLAATVDGVLPVDRYYNDKLYPWSVARTDNSLTKRREQVVATIIEEACREPEAVMEKLAAITILGETHQLFPHFETGMAFNAPYKVSDYSKASRDGFQRYLSQKVGSLARLNALLSTHHSRWEDIQPPDHDSLEGQDPDTERHINAYAHGGFPVSGWIAPQGQLGHGVVRIYLDGQLQGRAPVGLNRQDVLEALPALGSADVGWRYDLNFRTLASGPHQIDLYLERSGHPLQHLGTRHVEIVGNSGQLKADRWLPGLPATNAPDPALRYYIDAPIENARFRYNPLVPLWHDYRNQQVVQYIQHFQRLLANSCLGKTPLYTHQLVPYSNPSWDSNKYAVDASLQPKPGLNLGVSLYGETTYGNSMIRWLRGQGHTHYGVTEFHPLKQLSAEELKTTFSRHQAAGAQFISMFVEGRWQGHYMSEDRNLFAFDPDNHAYGSDLLFSALRAILNDPATRLDRPSLPPPKKGLMKSH